jgi:hypothetical protein
MLPERESCPVFIQVTIVGTDHVTNCGSEVRLGHFVSDR